MKRSFSARLQFDVPTSISSLFGIFADYYDFAHYYDMTDLSNFNSNGPSNPKNNIFGLPFSEEDARLVILPVPWEVTVSYGAGTSRAAEHIFHASMQVDL